MATLEKVDLSAAEFDGFRDAIEAAVKHYGKEGAYASGVPAKEKLADGGCKLKLVLCDGTLCSMAKFTVDAKGSVTDGWPGEGAGGAAKAAGGGDLATSMLETKDGNKVAAADALPGKVVVLYFSAHWCPPCRAFTPLLAKAYAEAKAAGKAVEIVFVSSDTDAAAQAEYMRAMHGDWLRVGYDDPLREALKQRYGTFGGRESGKFPGVARREGIPNIIVVGPGGEEHVFEEGESSVAIETKGAAAFDEWAQFAWPAARKRDASKLQS